MMFLSGADSQKYYKLRDDLSKDYAKGVDNYPNTVDGMMRLLNNYKIPTRYGGGSNRQQMEGGLAFYQGGSSQGQENGKGIRWRGEPGCYHCKALDHTKSNCPELKALEHEIVQFNVEEDHPSPVEGVQNLNVHELSGSGITMVQKKICGLSVLKLNHLYMDSCTSYASTPFREVLDGVSKKDIGLLGHGNAGSTFMGKSGELGDIKNIWVNEDGTANILPLSELTKIYQKTFDSAKSNKFTVHTKGGEVVLENNEIGMPYIDLDKSDHCAALCFIQTVHEIFAGFTKREVEEARSAHEAQAMIGNPTTREFRNMVHANIISNCTVTEQAIKNAELIFGPQLAGVHGRTTRTKPAAV